MRSSSLYVMISLSGLAFGAEIVSSHITQSLVLLISAYHMLYNILCLLLLIISNRMSKGKTLKNTFGWARLKVLGLLVNMLFLGALCFAVSVEAVQTMVHASHEDTEPRYPRLIIFLGAMDLAINIVCFVLIGGYTHHQGCSMIIQSDAVEMNCVMADTRTHSISSGFSEISDKSHKKSFSSWCWNHQLLDISRDVSSCLTVIACGCILLLMDGLILMYADAILAIASVIVLGSTTYPFVRESGLILLQSIPNHIDVEGLRKRLVEEFPDILDVHDLHIWRLTTSEIIATVHIILRSLDIYLRMESPLNKFFQKEGISSVTVQPEFTNNSGSEKKKLECILQCNSNNNCGALTCCGPLNGHTKSLSVRHRFSSTQETGMCNQVRNRTTLDDYDFSGFQSAVETTV